MAGVQVGCDARCVRAARFALDLLNELRAEKLSPAEFASELRRRGIVDYGEPVEARLIAEFRLARRDRRVVHAEALTRTKSGGQVKSYQGPDSVRVAVEIAE